MKEPSKRLRYDVTHWAREEDAAKALDQYLLLADRVFNRTAVRMLDSLAGSVSGKKVLDFGGGVGLMAIPYAKAGAEVVLVDAEDGALRTAQFYARREGVAQKVRTIQSQSFPNLLQQERFDMIVAKDIIEHIQDDQQFLCDLASCQDQGGVLLLSTQNSCSLNYLLEGTYQQYWRGNSSWCGWDQTHLRFYTPASLRQKLERAGYRAERWASLYLIPYNIFSWLFLLKLNIEIPALHYCDLSIGRIFPFNRLGWNVIVRAKREL